MKVSEFLKNEDIPSFLLGAFYSRTVFENDGSKPYAYTDYRITKFETDMDFYLNASKKYLKLLNDLCAPYSEWEDYTKTTEMNFRFVLENDLNLDETKFFTRLYSKILCSDFIHEDTFTEDKRLFLSGFTELRGSLDFSHKWIAMDYFHNDINELKRARLLFDNFNIPLSILNFNPRQLQKDYRNGVKRNAQFRIKLEWYCKNIGILNPYKAKLVKNMRDWEVIEKYDYTYFNSPELSLSKKDSFDNRLQYYANNIFDKSLTEFEIQQLRNELKFDNKNVKFARNKSLIELVRQQTPDICTCCGQQTFKSKNNLGQYFEIHHVISIGKNKELDDYNNMVKLCPNCHTKLKRGVADKNIQCECIANILTNCPNVLEFASMVFGSNNKNVLIDKIWSNIK